MLKLRFNKMQYSTFLSTSETNDSTISCLFEKIKQLWALNLIRSYANVSKNISSKYSATAYSMSYRQKVKENPRPKEYYTALKGMQKMSMQRPRFTF